MRLRTFHAPTIAEAMDEVRTALGDAAIIVSTHESARGRGAQVIAAIDDADEFETADSPDVQIRPGSSSGIADDLADVLSFHGVPARTAERLCRAVADFDAGDPVEVLAAVLDSSYDFADLDLQRRPVVLVGPPGAGKTLTVAKLAARLAFDQHAATVITTDNVRAGAVAQLQAYTDLIGHDLVTAGKPERLAEAIDTVAGNRPVLIDTPGTNPFNADEIEDLRRFLRGLDIEPVLVLPAGGDAEDAGEAAAAFARLGCRKLIVTRLDGARRLGGLLAAAEAGRLAFTEVSITASVAQGLRALGPLSLARILTRDPLKEMDLPEVGARSA